MPDLMSQKDKLTALIVNRARSLDFVRPSEPEELSARDSSQQTDADLAKVMRVQEHLLLVGRLRTDGLAWAEEPLTCCKGRARCCCAIRSASLQIVMSMQGTVLEWCIKGVQMWISVSVYIVTRILVRRFRKPEEQQQFPPMDAPHIIGGFLSFFLVFYASQAYRRFNAMYNNSMACLGRIFDVCTLAKVNMERAAALRIWRHVNLAHVLAYTDVSDTYGARNFLEPMNQKYGLCSRAEWRRILELNPDSSSDATREAIAWAVNDVMVQTKPIERPHRALEHISLPALIKRAKRARVPASMYDEHSTLHKMAYPADDLEPLELVDDEKRELIKAILKDPDAAPPIHTWNTNAVKEWILDLDGVVFDDVKARRAVSEALDMNGITGSDMLQFTPGSLNALGISHVHSQMRIMEAIRSLTGENEMLPAPLGFKLVSELLNLRGQLALLYDSQWPVPFFYIHLLHLTSAIYLPMFAYSLAIGSDIPESCDSVDKGSVCWNKLWWEMSGLIMIGVQNIIVIGLVRSGQQLSDPFGADIVDLPVRSWVMWALDSSKAMLTSSSDPVAPTDSIEEAINDLRPPTNQGRRRLKTLLTGNQMKGMKNKIARLGVGAPANGVAKPKATATATGRCYHCGGMGHLKQDCPLSHVSPKQASATRNLTERLKTSH